MEALFPTFRRFVGWLSDGFYWPRAASRVQQRSLLRLLLAAHEENVPLGRLIETWAEDETGGQGVRLRRLAALLQKGVPLPAAVEEVRGVLSDEDVLAIRFGFQSGALAATVRDRLAQPVSLFVFGSTRVRNLIPYFSFVCVIAFFLTAFFMIKIVPEFEKISEEFDLTPPASFRSSVHFANLLSDYWFLFALAFLAIWFFVFTTWPGRPLRLRLANLFFRPARELRFASVLQNLSVATLTGRPLAGALSTLARYHFDPILRNQLLFIRNELDHGADVWECMAAMGLMSSPEVRALQTSEHVGDRGWVLAQLAQVRRDRTRWQLARWAELALPIVVLFLGAFVFWQALGVFQTLTNFISSMAV